MKRFDEMRKLRGAALQWKDPEGVHSMRVASRRLRSALTDFMPYISKRGLNAILKDIRSIADALGEVRDQDVTILALEKLESETPPEVAVTVRDLILARKKIRRTARRKLKKVIVKDEIKKLGADLQLLLEKATTENKSKTVATPGFTYLTVARSVIAERLNELEMLSDSLYKPLEPEPMHEMRIAAKRLRYAIELFEECWQVPIGPFAKQASRLQSALGKVHDCDVWITTLSKEAVALRKSRHRKRSETFVWLFSHFIELRNTHFREAFALWSQWESENFSRELGTVIKN
jgi:CHAD domain-containing protein